MSKLKIDISANKLGVTFKQHGTTPKDSKEAISASLIKQQAQLRDLIVQRRRGVLAHGLTLEQLTTRAFDGVVTGIQARNMGLVDGTCLMHEFILANKLGQAVALKGYSGGLDTDRIIAEATAAYLH